MHPVLTALTMNTRASSIEDRDAIDGFSPAVRDEPNDETRLKAAIAAHVDNSKPYITWDYHHYFHGKLSAEPEQALNRGNGRTRYLTSRIVAGLQAPTTRINNL